MRKLLLLLGLVVAPFSVTPIPANAQIACPPQINPNAGKTDSLFLALSKSTARRAAEELNGGLNTYRAERSMYGPTSQSPHVINPDGSITFTFKGGPPANRVPTLETSVVIKPDRSYEVLYNRPLAPAEAAACTPQTNPTPVTADLYFLGRSKNIARRVAEELNGGLSNYRAEQAMYGVASQAPHAVNADGSVTFTFKGGPPGATVPTLETSITVNLDRTYEVLYNRPL